MKQFPVNFRLWSRLLFFCFLQSGTKGNSSDICQEQTEADMIYMQNATESNAVEKIDVEETFVCLLYPWSELNCSWSFHTLKKDSQLSVHISVCKDDMEILSLKRESAERVSSATLPVAEMTSVVLQFNMSLHGGWMTYTSMYDKSSLDLLSPPSHINASRKDKDLIVSWVRPPSQTIDEPKCFEYQLDMGDQKEHQIIQGGQSHEEPNADPTHTYRVRVRARIRSNCHGCPEWSGWSRAVVVEPSFQMLNPKMMILLTLGIHLTLAILLLVHRQRVLQVLFPPIPRPPPKYKCFLEKSDDAFNFFYPAVTAHAEEEVTEVEDEEKSSPNTCQEDDMGIKGKCEL